MKLLSIYFLILLKGLCFSQESGKIISIENKKKHVEIVIWKEKKMVKHKITDTIEIQLMSGFDDTVYVYLNGKCLYYGYCKTNKSISWAESIYIPKSIIDSRRKNYIYLYRKKNNKKEKMLGLYLDLRYKYVSIYRFEESKMEKGKKYNYTYWKINFENTMICCAE